MARPFPHITYCDVRHSPSFLSAASPWSSNTSLQVLRDLARVLCEHRGSHQAKRALATSEVEREELGHKLLSTQKVMQQAMGSRPAVVYLLT
jgi:hypothetical protein